MLCAKIGEAAGVLWKTLSDKGPTSVAGLVKATGLDKDLVQQAIGWLAREDKLSVASEGKKGIVVSLK